MTIKVVNGKFLPMDSILSLVNFFYNILPGIYFFTLVPSSILDIKNLARISSDAQFSNIIIFISFSLLVGFVFQGLTKIVRFSFLDRVVVASVIRTNKKNWLIAKAILKARNLPVDDELHAFYLMDNYTNSLKTNVLPSYFSTRTSLWANLAWANFFILIIEPNYTSKMLYAIFLITTIFIAGLNFNGLQDTVLKSFLMQIDNFKELNLLGKSNIKKS